MSSRTVTVSKAGSLMIRVRADFVMPSAKKRPEEFVVSSFLRAAAPTVPDGTMPSAPEDTMEEREYRFRKLADWQSSGLRDGTVIADLYRLGSPIGQGGMGWVCSAIAVGAEQEVAIKFPRSDARRSDHDEVTFLAEAKCARSVDHPNVISILDFGVDRRLCLPFIVMQKVRGRTLRQAISQDGPMPVWRALHLCGEVARALTACHRLRLIHRDVKPENILLTETLGGRAHVTLIDFGVARHLDGRCAKEELVGTLSYMSKEQAMGGPVDHRADLFSLGCILQEMLTGRPPFTSKENMLRFSGLMRPAVPRIPLDLPQRLADPVADLHAALLQPNPQDRPSSAQAVSDTVDALLAMAEHRPAVAA